MDDAHDVIPHGACFVRDGRIVAVWGPKPPQGVSVGGASIVDAGPQELLFPGLIDLHDHPSFDVPDLAAAVVGRAARGREGRHRAARQPLRVGRRRLDDRVARGAAADRESVER
jgi:imidazolonepropionase-like amidohydrolase